MSHRQIPSQSLARRHGDLHPWLIADEAPSARARLGNDLALAAQIQKSFLPREAIAVEGLDLFVEYRAAYAVGGDFYDVLWVGPNRLALLIGDISGKGVSGALLMARISAELRTAALNYVEPVAVLTAMNQATVARGRPELFFTAIYLILDVKTGEALFANAGHPVPYVLRANGALESTTVGHSCAVGIIDDPDFVAAPLHLDHGDTLILYTDGVVEAANEHGSLYGQERLEACLATAELRPRAIAEHILRSVASHTTKRPANDDLTLLIGQRTAGEAPTMQPRSRSSTFPAPVVQHQSKPGA
jgi:phosphoserine phosphatase RsbU/P